MDGTSQGIRSYYSGSNFNHNEKENFYTALFGALPFALLLVTFLIVWCRRNIEDYYLKWSIFTFITAMSLRISMSAIIMMLATTAKVRNNELLEIKFLFVSFALPYYCFLMVTVSLLFSVHKFYHDAKSLLYSRSEPKGCSCLISMQATKCRFFVLQASICAGLLTQIVILLLKREAESTTEIFDTVEVIFLCVSQAILYLVQIVVLVIGCSLTLHLIRMNKEEPVIEANIPHSEMITKQIKRRLPRIICAFAILLVLQTSCFLLYNLKYLDSAQDASKNIFDADIGYQIIQICLELLFCINLSVAICMAQPKRKSTKGKKRK